MILSRGNMQIAFDVSPMINSHKSGVGYCTHGFVKTMVSQYDNNYILNYISKPKYKENLNTLVGGKKVKINSFCFKNSVYKVASTFLPIPYGAFFKDSADITHFFNYYLPPGVKGKKIVTVHDMAYKRFPETVRFKTRKMLDISLKKSINRADLIITVSEFSKQEILSFFPQCARKIEVVYNGVDLNVFRPMSDQVMIEKVKRKYNIEGDFLLYLGTIEPRKNIERLLEAYSLIKKKLRYYPKLVLAGGKGWLDSGIFRTLEKLKLKDNVVFSGYVGDEDVPVLMNAARAFLFPSIYEGFGMPIIEGQAIGRVVITSNISPMNDISKGSCVFVDPYSIESMKNGYIEAIRNSHYYVEKGLENVKRFSLSTITNEYLDLYRSLKNTFQK